ncbi:MAG: PAS domain-containing protein [Nitrospirae bacterium]|uniref:Signal transduction histidine kinase n=1 Tax=uncultured Nitrospirota bacterium TaxID=170969 RepID=A0A142BTT7_9BACT|nr:signal transduction histidine kinase [uncultured Nitrospirota bacterium]MBF0328618.1 PAS domain-containing protein [Nitrospirota bacterium]
MDLEKYWSDSFDILTDMVTLHDSNFKIVRANKAFLDALKSSSEGILGRQCYDVMHCTKEPHGNCPFVKSIDTKKTTISEIFEPLLNSHLEITAYPILNEQNDGKVEGIIHFVKTINERKEMEDHLVLYNEQLQKVIDDRTKDLQEANNNLTLEVQARIETENKIMASLKDKEILLKEVHHRVKNNLQIISSLLSLQTESLNSDNYQNVFRDSLNSIRTMALIHEKLYQSSDMSHLHVLEYFQELTAELIASFRQSFVRPVLKLDISIEQLPIDTMIPCALIVCELVSNCLKYAFPDKKEGEIKIGFHQLENGSRLLVVSDNGVGLPESFSFKTTRSLGVQLVHDLVTRKLKGSITVDREHGTEFRITF